MGNDEKPKLFGYRHRGEPDFYHPQRDILAIFPSIVIHAALELHLPKSAAHWWLEHNLPGGTKMVRAHLEYTLRVLSESKSVKLVKIFDANKVNETVYLAFMMAIGIVMAGAYGDLWRMFTGRTLIGGVREPYGSEFAEVSEAMRAFDLALPKWLNGYAKLADMRLDGEVALSDKLDGKDPA